MADGLVLYRQIEPCHHLRMKQTHRPFRSLDSELSTLSGFWNLPHKLDGDALVVEPLYFCGLLDISFTI